MRKHAKLASTMMVAGLFLVGCGGGGSSIPFDRLPDPTVRFFNASPDSAGLTFKINDDSRAANLEYFQSSPDFAAIPFVNDEDGAIDYSISNAADDVELERDNAFFDRDKNFLIVAFGKVNPGVEFEKGLQQVVMEIDRRPVQGKARLFILNAYVNSQGSDNRQINFQTVDPTNPNSTQRPQFNRNNLVYGAFRTDSSVLDIDPGTRTFQARAADSDGVVILAQKTFVFEANTLYFALVTGQADATDPARQPKIEFFPLSPR